MQSPPVVRWQLPETLLAGSKQSPCSQVLKPALTWVFRCLSVTRKSVKREVADYLRHTSHTCIAVGTEIDCVQLAHSFVPPSFWIPGQKSRRGLDCKSCDFQIKRILKPGDSDEAQSPTFTSLFNLCIKIWLENAAACPASPCFGGSI